MKKIFNENSDSSIKFQKITLKIEEILKIRLPGLLYENCAIVCPYIKNNNKK